MLLSHPQLFCFCYHFRVNITNFLNHFKISNIINQSDWQYACTSVSLYCCYFGYVSWNGEELRSVFIIWVFGFRSVQDQDHVNWAVEAGATFKNYKSNNPSYTKKYLVTKKQTNKQCLFSLPRLQTSCSLFRKGSCT